MKAAIRLNHVIKTFQNAIRVDMKEEGTTDWLHRTNKQSDSLFTNQTIHLSQAHTSSGNRYR